ncbi:anhydro-N-acetylmuramic acid kinase [Legionella waltersii]|uniref:Anhydro-N-acetylmuramic acid kinase n=2 Tax=Legionella waltersii TaxID=66969 RepID=A0A0W1AM66_9GAMM|nr:anhydro-N-acetylmuramic acid kinase [Legionella waltersii]SNV04193.1 anhydro-N-acetylmuramic acid kinase [Legionella waltersii]
MDGIDAALVELPSNRLVHGITQQYSIHVKQRLKELSEKQVTSLPSICQLNTEIGREFAAAVHSLLQEVGLKYREITAIGSHGQTVCHDADASIPYTLQLGCPHTISSLTGITVIADFRTRDIVHGGQGAPFAPVYHAELLKNKHENVALVNIGGISNITFIEPNGSVKGWDVGPGNCLMDAWIAKHKKQAFDKNGDWASQGKIIQPLLDDLLQDPFFLMQSPKSIGKEYYSLIWLEEYVRKEYSAVDVQATLAMLTAKAIADAIREEAKQVKTVLLCGGGTHNTHLNSTLRRLLPEISIKSVENIGISPDYLEAMMFAWLAAQTMNQNPIDLTRITGSNRPNLLGAIYPILKEY